MKPHRFLASTVILVALATTVASVAEEGDRGGRRGRFRGPPRRPTVSASMLLRSPKVREELKVSDEQAKKIDEIQARQRGKMEELHSDDLSRKERRKKAKAFHKEADAAVVSALAEDQAKRLNEIVLQQRGVDGLVSDDVVAALKLDDDQLSKIKAAIVARNEELRKLRPQRRRRDADGDGDRDKRKDAREKAAKLFKSTEATIVALLSEGQREAFEELKGEPFKLDRRELFRGRGGRRGDRDRGGRRGGKRKRPPVDDDKRGTDV